MNARIRNNRLAVAVIRVARRLRIAEAAIERRRQPCQCNATAKAIAHVQAQWVVAGIDRD